MLPDGAHHRAEDWTIFYLGQSPSNAVASVAMHESEVTSDSGTLPGAAARTQVTTSVRGKRGVYNGAGLLYVLNCVRMKEDKSMRRYVTFPINVVLSASLKLFQGGDGKSSCCMYA